MSLSMVKKLLMYRSILVAFLNAGLTWIILIIAPLGLFSVIICTMGVFVTSLVGGWVGDRFLFTLVINDRRDVISAHEESNYIESVFLQQVDVSNLQQGKKN
ncbi:CRISPR-associated protein Csx18 [Chrysosporum bergii ANA360D]|uniref:CRISPR-associated protein Csx18 n=1 Tax=Chrysosporum bergii ANA360D TaxID=617107 RepID=A0AA43GTF8_9CYAN|nr:CRISPR-associated protein Csx18 [Chrysosporum bergii]MDH6061255.1 CRISPR-associated protein Csx18 [Chrysosporum bergii ANA360D]